MTNEQEEAHAWIDVLRRHVEQSPLAVLTLSEDEMEALLSSRNGMTEFTLTLRHSLLRGVVTPCVCIVLGTRPATYLAGSHATNVAYVAILKSKAPVSTLTTRIKLKRTALVRPRDAMGFAKALGNTRFARDFEKRVSRAAPLVLLAPKLSVAIVEALVAVESNRGALRTLAAGLHKPRAGTFENLQFDAVETALKAFGLTPDAPAAELDLARHSRSSLAQARIMEDAAIEHDARVVPGYDFIGSDVTGRATFRNGQQTLEVYTANRRKLEEAFGVDLIYLNLFQRNIVMVQYKMLEPSGARDFDEDWLYREDSHLSKQLKTMRLFASPDSKEEGYRLSDETFYFKFVRRVGPSPRTNVLLPLSHFEQLLEDRAFRTQSGAVKVAHSALHGRYMRQTAFFSLLQAGYIGANASDASHLRALVEDVASGGDALVVAVQRETSARESELDRQRLLRMYEDEESGYH